MGRRTTARVHPVLVAIFAMATLPCFAGEVAVLKNGFSIRHERREVVGETTRLYVTADGSSFVDVPTADIEHFEAAPESSASGSRRPASGLDASSFGKSAHDKSPSLSPFAKPRKPAFDLNDVVNAASGRHRLDPDLVNSVIKAESGFN